MARATARASGMRSAMPSGPRRAVTLVAMPGRGWSASARIIPARRNPGLLRLVHRPRWLLANALGALGWPLQAAALLLVVQPALGIGLVPLALIGARSLGEPVSRRDAAAILGRSRASPASRGPRRARAGSRPGRGRWRRRSSSSQPPRSRRTRAHGFAQLLSDALDAGQLALAGLWLVGVVLAAAVGVLSENGALQRRGAAPVAGIVFATGALAPVGLAPALFGERRPGGVEGVMLATPVAVVIAGAITLESSRALSGMRVGEERGERRRLQARRGQLAHDLTDRPDARRRPVRRGGPSAAMASATRDPTHVAFIARA